MATARGSQAYVLIGPEVTYGVAAVTGFHKAEVISVSCDPVIGIIQDPSLYNKRARRGLHQGGLMYRGSIKIRANYEGPALLLLMRAAMLGYAGTVVAAGPPTSNNHTFTDGSTLRSLTMQMQEGGVATNLQEVRGMVVTGWTFRTTAGTSGDAMGVYEFQFVAQSKTENIVEASGGAVTTYALVNPVLYHQCITQSDGSGDATPIIRSLEVSYSAPYDDGRYQLGSVNPLQPIPNDFLVGSIKVTREFDSTAMFVKARSFAAPAAALDFVFQGAVILASNKFETQFKAVNARLQDYSNPVEDYGVIVATGTWLLYDDPNTILSSLLVRIKNSDAVLA